MSAPFNPKAKDWVEGRKNWREDLEALSLKKQPIVWLHAASLGEMEQGVPVLKALREKLSDHQFVISFFSPSGYKNFKDRELADAIVYLPLDLPKNAHDFVKILNPDLAIFIKYEIWPNFLQALKKQKVKTLLAPAVFRANQVYFKPYGEFFRSALEAFDSILVQDLDSLKLINKIGLRADICGDSRFDQALEIKNSEYQVAGLNEWISNQLCLITGSSWPKEEALLVELLKQKPHLKLIIAPHEVESDNIQRIHDLFHVFGVNRFSESTWLSQNQVLIIDNIGQLKKLYRYSDLVLVGGGFGVSVHSTVEPSVYEVPIAFGPNHQKFVETKEMLAQGLAFEIQNSSDLNAFIEKFESKTSREAFKAKMQEYLNSKAGAAKKISENAFKLLGYA